MIKYPARIIWRILVFLFIIIYQILSIFFTYFAQIMNKLWDWKEPWWDIKWSDFWWYWEFTDHLSMTIHKSCYKNPWQALLGKEQYIY